MRGHQLGADVPELLLLRVQRERLQVLQGDQQRRAVQQAHPELPVHRQLHQRLSLVCLPGIQHP